MADDTGKLASLMAYYTLESVRTRLEAFADAFERLADSPAQKELADNFEAYAADFVRRPLGMADLNSLANALNGYADRFARLGQASEFLELVFELVRFGKECGEAWEHSLTPKQSAGGNDGPSPGAAERLFGTTERSDRDGDGEENHRVVIDAMSDEHREQGFRALHASSKNGGSSLEDADGDYRPWPKLSPEGKLASIAWDAAYYGVGFEPFAAVVREELGEIAPAAREEVALRQLLRDKIELHELACLVPDDPGTNFPPPLVDQFRWLLNQPRDYSSDTAEGAQELLRSLQTVLTAFDASVGTRQGRVAILTLFGNQPKPLAAALEWRREAGTAVGLAKGLEPQQRLERGGLSM